MTEGHVGGERPAAVALAEAAAAAGYAPSVHNTQPWRWRVHPDRLELYAERARQLAMGDPEGRLLLAVLVPRDLPRVDPDCGRESCLREAGFLA